MDAEHVADALIEGRTLSAATLRRILNIGDSADALYVGLYQIVVDGVPGPETAKAVSTPSAHLPTAAAWSCILSYAEEPLGARYAQIIRAVRVGDTTGTTVVRLAPLVLAARHRRHFSIKLRRASDFSRLEATELIDIERDLRLPGPQRLYATRRVALSKRPDA